MKVKELRNKYGLTLEELAKLCGVPYNKIEIYENGDSDICNASDINLFRLSVVLGGEDGCGYKLLEDKEKEQVIKEVKKNYIHELAKTEIDECANNEYAGKDGSIYSLCTSNLEMDYYKGYVEYRYPNLFILMSYIEIQEAVRDEIGKQIRQGGIYNL